MSPAEEGHLSRKKEDTAQLFRQYKQSGDVAIRNQLVQRYLGLVYSIVRRFTNRGEPWEDLIQVGSLALIKAVGRYKIDLNIEFTTYATPTIEGEIKRYFRDKGWVIKVPRRFQELNRQVHKEIEELTKKLGHSPKIPEIAHNLGVSEEEVLESLEVGKAYKPISLDARLESKGGEEGVALSEVIGKVDQKLESLITRISLEEAMEVLDKRERVILTLRFYENLLQTEIAQRLNISQMHVSRLQRQALEKLKQFMKKK